ncbi:MAG TPA: hypothetical protein VJS44_04085 [Pyrinomonadaceae bacterium]|nr:hypothetical protein [Pyrinomonadaceae bacterium]
MNMRLAERKRAITRGLRLIYELSRDPEIFSEYGSDLLSCFYFTAATSKDPELCRMSRRMGLERARAWRSDFRSVPDDADVSTILFFMHGTLSAEGFGLADESLKEEIRRAASSFEAYDFLSFDPMDEPPPVDVPEQCECGYWNERGRKMCRQCRKRLLMASRYRVWYEGLMMTYTAAKLGVSLGASYWDVLKWLPVLHPYRGREDDENEDFYDSVYAVTHIVYTLNDYSVYRLRPQWLPQEFEFLKASVEDAIAMEDPEMLGEITDSLQAFGLKETHPLIRRGIDYLLSSQNADGSWGHASPKEDIYAYYHSTWTAIDGLRQYPLRPYGLSFHELKPLLKQLQ